MMKLKLLLAMILACTAVLQSTNAITLPFEVEETLLDLMGTKDISKINKQSIVPIYRKDLDPNYIAYYEINHGKQFLVLSAGPKTKDYRNAESGASPSPTKVLVNQARKAGQRCHKFFRLTSMGLYMCENKNGVAVAATFDWIADAPVQDWRKLQKMVDESIDDFKKAWKDHAASVKDEGKTSRRKKVDQSPGTGAYEAEIVSPGSTAKVALEKNHRQVSIHAIPEKRQKELCAILVDVCKNSTTNVNPKRIHKTTNGIRYLRFEVNEDNKFVRKILQNKEISFYFKIKTTGGEKLLKYFSVDLSSHWKRRWSSWDISRIYRELDLFPDYKQHTCCGGCKSGCGPVAWAQILGYYDRLAYYSPSSGFSRRFWTCKDEGSDRRGDCVAPANMTTSSRVEKYIERIRSMLGTFCVPFTQIGLTPPSQMNNIIKFYIARGIRGRVHIYDHFSSVLGWPTFNWIRDRAANHVKAGYPAIVGFWSQPATRKNRENTGAVSCGGARQKHLGKSAFTSTWAGEVTVMDGTEFVRPSQPSPPEKIDIDITATTGNCDDDTILTLT